jgi:hypothetical protein
MEVFSTFITIARPMGDDPGAIEPGHYTVADDVVTLTNSVGEPLASGRMQTGYSAKISPDENQAQTANRLLWRHYRAAKSGSDFNRRIRYPPLSIA